MSLISAIAFGLGIFVIFEQQRRNPNDMDPRTDTNVGKVGLLYILLMLLLFGIGTVTLIGDLFSGSLFTAVNIVSVFLGILFGVFLVRGILSFIIGTGINAFFDTIFSR